ncbi:pyruvate dehydrogenase (quinone) [Micromonospora pisi]|uniref:Pyruvate dehydrogenase (Quinone) n=1 Tax=Micromonospora pisi TaxID=589240 RepID=A0A495JU28_9ACTN|nr:thiamine pyrophosphate-requiring protein [Micromonospora pisi]RKR92493.1 pyruvate dehydrogenase (quinone) [Micromonospora pisi]
MAESVRTVADLLVERLRAWHVPRVFGASADGVEPIVAALGRAGGDPAFVQARHEETAGFMATGHAKFTGGVGVCLAAQGPGVVHLLGGLYDAKLDGKPVVAIVGQQLDNAFGAAYQEIELTRLLSDVCGEFVRVAETAEQVASLIDRAFRTAVATRSPTCVIVPQRLQAAAVPDLPPQTDGVYSMAPGLPPARVLPHEEDLNAAAQLLGAGQRVAIMVGQGGYGAAEEIVALADQVGAGITTSLLGKPVLDERLPFHTGVMGHLGTTASAQLLGGCDTLLLIGTNDPWTDYYPLPGQAATIQIDIDGRRLANRYPVDVPLIGDAVETLRALLPRVPHRANREWRDRIELSFERWWSDATARADTPAEPVNPQHVLRELSPRLPWDAAVAVDVGSVTYWYARHVQLAPGVPAHICGTFASTGSALPYGVAAKLAMPDRPVVVLAGDGAMQMNGLAELVTVANRWHDWADPRFVMLVLNNRDQAGMSLVQRESGRQALPEAQRLPDVPYAGWARLLGMHGLRVDRPELVGAAWDEALAADRPTLIEAVVDATVPLSPPDQPFADLRGLLGEREEIDGTEAASRSRTELVRERAVAADRIRDRSGGEAELT